MEGIETRTIYIHVVTPFSFFISLYFLYLVAKESQLKTISGDEIYSQLSPIQVIDYNKLYQDFFYLDMFSIFNLFFIFECFLSQVRRYAIFSNREVLQG